MEIRPVRDHELPEALRVMAEAFGTPYEVPSAHTLVVAAPTGTLLVAKRDGRIVGTAGALGFGPTGWVGGVTVAAEARGAGLGRALTEAAVAALGPRETLLLLATPLGRPIYDRLGFLPECEYRVYAAPPDAAPQPDGTRPADPADREAILALDRHATGETRTVAVDAGLDGALVTPDLSGVALRPPWAARPILARHPGAGETLLAATLEPGLRLAVPAPNARAAAALEALGASERRRVVRMRRGSAVEWRPECVWGVFALFFS